jgi:hypothetical protein
VGAMVTAAVNGTLAGLTVSGLNGSWTLELPLASYLLRATFYGYAPAETTLFVRGPMSGVLLPLVLQSYIIRGMVRDGLSDLGVAGATIVSGSLALARSDAQGSYSFMLPNGTYFLSVEPPAGGKPYGPTAFQLSVEGASISRDLLLFPRMVTLSCTVADNFTGLQIPGAQVRIAGMTSVGSAVNESFPVGLTGQLQVDFPEGNYSLSASANGYQPASAAIVLTAPLAHYDLLLNPLNQSTHAGSLPFSQVAEYAGLVGALAGACALALRFSRRGLQRTGRAKAE